MPLPFSSRQLQVTLTLEWDLFAALLRDDPDELIRLIREDPAVLLGAAEQHSIEQFQRWTAYVRPPQAKGRNDHA